MKISNNYASNQTFRAQSEHMRSFMGDVTDVLDSTADFVKVAKSAIDTPEEASVKVLNDQIENVANNKKTPGWAKTGLKYVSAALTAGLTGIAIYKTPGGVKNLMNRFNFGKSILKFTDTIKENIGTKINKFKKNSKLFKSIGKKISTVINSSKQFVKKKFPKLNKLVANGLKKLHYEKWTKSGTIKGAIATALGLSSGKKVLNKYDNNSCKNNEPEVDDVDSKEYDEAA